jgi:hypothetical protein
MCYRFVMGDRVLLHNIYFPAFTLFTAKDQPVHNLCDDSEKELLFCLQQNRVKFDPECVVLVLCTFVVTEGAALTCDFSEAVVFQMRKPVGAAHVHAQVAAPADFLP